MRSDGFFSPRSVRPIHLGVGLVVAGVLLILITWYKIAELVLVPAQFPLLVSGGLTGLVLVLVGLTLVNVHVKRQESAKRIEATDRLARLVAGDVGPFVPRPATPEADTADLRLPADEGWEAAEDPQERVSRSVWG